MSDDFTKAARAEANSRTEQWGDERNRRRFLSMFTSGAEWARTYLAAQEPTDAEVEAAGEVWQAHSRLAHPIEDLEPSCAECGYAFGWPGISESEERKRHREHVARAALSAARAARRDEEKR